MDLSNFGILNNELMKKDPDLVPEQAPLTILDIKSDVCIYKNGKDTKQTIHISTWMYSVRNGKEWNLHKIVLCEGGL